MNIKIKRLSKDAKIPTQATKGDAGYDLYAVRDVVIAPLSRAVVSTAIQVEIPEGYYGRIAPRSGLAVKNGIDVLAGVVDCGYRGELGVVLVNLSTPTSMNFKSLSKQQVAHQGLFGDSNAFKIKQGDRVAQLIIEKCHEVEWEEVENLESSEREDGKFGSSGK